jgi:hypothetical protein
LHEIIRVPILGVYMACNTNRLPDGRPTRLVADVP